MPQSASDAFFDYHVKEGEFNVNHLKEDVKQVEGRDKGDRRRTGGGDKTVEVERAARERGGGG